MKVEEPITTHSESLIELLAGQCADLEKLLALSREETAAAKTGNFEEVLEIVRKRDEIGERLETFQKQINSLHGLLLANDASRRRKEISERIILIANLTLAQDEKNLLLLIPAREKAYSENRSLERSLRESNAYIEDKRKGLACNRVF